jgi:hypothetical protein
MFVYSGGTHSLGCGLSTQYAAYPMPCSSESRACGQDHTVISKQSLAKRLSHAALHAPCRANGYLDRSEAPYSHCAGDAIRENVRLGQKQLYCDLHLPIRPAFHPACVEVQ